MPSAGLKIDISILLDYQALVRLRFVNVKASYDRQSTVVRFFLKFLIPFIEKEKKFRTFA